MEGDSRREQIISLLNQKSEPVSGGELARYFHVSRQVIVQDIALLRAADKNILSTTKGYLIHREAASPAKYYRTYAVFHTDAGIEEELLCIVDCGGTVLDIIVEHEVYGQITVDLLLESRKDVGDFMRRLGQACDKPLSILTNGRHYHTVRADNEEILDHIESVLRQKNYLISDI